MLWLSLVLTLVSPPEFIVEVSPQVFAVETSPELDVKPPKQKLHYIVMFTADWCGPCRNWKSNGGPETIRAAGYNLTIVDIDKSPKWKSKVDKLPTFWLVDHATRNPQYRYIGTTPAETLLKKAEQLEEPAVADSVDHSLFGFTGTSHESRQTLINHLMNDGVHRGRHTLKSLQSMTDEQLDKLHSENHAE